MLCITPNQATLIGAFGGAVLGAVIGGAVSFFVARYTVNHGANYAGQIDTINQALNSLAVTQEEIKQHYAQFRFQAVPAACHFSAEFISYVPSRSTQPTRADRGANKLFQNAEDDRVLGVVVKTYPIAMLAMQFRRHVGIRICVALLGVRGGRLVI